MYGGGTPQSTSQALSVPAYVRKKALNPGKKIECTRARIMGKFPDVQFGIRFSTWNVGSISGKWGEISETLKRCCVDICCVQEVRWKGQGARMTSNGFKFFWSGSAKAVNGVDVIVANWLIGKIVEVERYSDRVMKVNIVIGDVAWEVVSCYFPQAGRSVNEKEEFYELMDKFVTSYTVLVGSDFNDHVGSDVGGFGEVHGDFGIGQINNGGIRLLDWAVIKGLRLMNTYFQKRKSWLVTFRSAETETMIDYILVNNKYRSSVKDVKVIPGEEIVSQRCLLLMDMVFRKKVKRKVKFRKKLKLWRLRESELKEEFADGVNNKCDGNEDWYNLKSKLLDVASEVCGYTSLGKPRHIETWWWNKDVDVAVRRKRELFRIWRQSWNEEDRKKYCEAKKDANRVVYMAMDQKAREVVGKVDWSRDGRELFRIAKKRAGEKSDIVGVSCLKDESGR